MKKIVFLCMVMGCGLYGLSGMAEPSVKLPEILPAKPMTPLRPTVEELNKAKEKEATALREKEKADAEIARLQKELAKKPKEANPPPAPAASADAAPVLVAPSAVTAALDWVDEVFSKLKELDGKYYIASIICLFYYNKHKRSFMDYRLALIFTSALLILYISYESASFIILNYLKIDRNYNLLSSIFYDITGLIFYYIFIYHFRKIRL